MVTVRRKKRSPIIFVTGIFVAVVVIMFVARERSALVEKIHFPLNSGVAELSTCGDFLAAISRDSQIYVWQWTGLSKEARTGSIQSNQAALLKPDLVASIRQDGPKVLTLTNVRGDKRYKEISVGPSGGRAYLEVNRKRDTVAILLTEAQDYGGSRANYEVVLVDCDSGRVDPIVRVTGETASGRFTNLAVSDDGTFVAVVGHKGGRGAIALINVKEKQLVWERMVPDLEKLYNAAFSIDGEVIYVRGSDSTVKEIETITGDISRQFLPLRENRSTLKSQHAQSVLVSPNGRFVAAVVVNTVFAWDCTDGKKIFEEIPSHKLVSKLAFSPDSRFLATSDLRQGGRIEIWRMPRL